MDSSFDTLFAGLRSSVLVQMVPQVLTSAIFIALAVSTTMGVRKSGSRASLAIASAQPLLFLLLFATLGLHMHSTLGGWPRAIGNDGFPVALDAHATVAGFLFGSLILGLIFIVPVGSILCAFIAPLRPGLRAVGSWAAVTLVAFFTMSLAPSQFLYWWWD